MEFVCVEKKSCYHEKAGILSKDNNSPTYPSSAVRNMVGYNQNIEKNLA